MLNALDIFSGIGGFTLALAPWVRPVAYCEINEYACGVLLSRMADHRLPHAPIWDDVTTLRAEHLAGAEIDIITGGFPCQDLSVAGSRRGLEGERSGLYREVLRLVGKLRPRFVFLENVPGIRKHAHVVVGDLARLGYDCRWTTLSAAEVGAPHRRERWWLLAHANGESVRQLAERQLAERQQCKPTKRRNAKPTDAARDGVGTLANADSRGQSGHGESDNTNRGEPSRDDVDGRFALPSWERESAPFPSIRSVDDGLSRRLERLECFGNAVVPRQAREAFRYLAGLR